MPGDSLRLKWNNYYLTQGLRYAKKNVQYQIQIAGCEKDIANYKIKIDSCGALDQVHKSFEAKQAGTIAKLEKKNSFFKGLAGGLAFYALVREGLNYLKPK